VKKGEKKQRDKALRKQARDRRDHKRARVATPSTALHHIRQAHAYPLEGCWTMRDWEENGLAVVIVARRQPDGNILFGSYLVDYYCLGVKDAYYNADIPPGMFRRDYLPKMLRGEKPVEISPALAHELIYGSIDYAAQFGFKPHSDFKVARHILDPADAHPHSGTVTFGKDGKPLFIAGPYDNSDAILRQLTRTAGEGNFHYLVPVESPDEFIEIDDEY
jgi:hypothetical protein